MTLQNLQHLNSNHTLFNSNQYFHLICCVLQAAGVTSAESVMEPALALEALQQMKYRLERIQLELEGFKLKVIST